MRFVLLLAALSTAALADVGPRPPSCKVPEGCVTCGTDYRDESFGVECRAQAADAGLVESECSDRSGSTVQRYFCPKDKPATRPSCAAVSADALALGALLFLRRRR